jgi:hypothetical protein
LTFGVVSGTFYQIAGNSLARPVFKVEGKTPLPLQEIDYRLTNE